MLRANIVRVCAVLFVTGCAGVETPSRGDGPSGLRRQVREVVTAMTPSRMSEPPNLQPSRRAVTEAIHEVKGSVDGIASRLPALAANTRGLGGADGLFTRYTDYGASQLPWLRSALVDATTLVAGAEVVSDEDMARGLLGMTGPRLQAAMSGAMLLEAWSDFLHLAEVVRQECPFYGIESLFVDLERVRRRIEPAMTELASLEPERVEARATAMPELMGELTREFQSIREGARLATERAGRAMAVARFMEMLTLASALKATLSRPPPAAPITLGTGLVVGSGGVMLGSRIVVTAEWVERMRDLVRAGVLSVPAVSAAVRIHAGQVMMSRADRDLPQGVRDALGDGPEVRSMRETGRAGAGMSDAPRHHVLPREHREWFEKRGFKGAMDIDQFCVRLEKSHHEAVHGGGDWRMGRTWPKEWNQMIMRLLRDAEDESGRMLTRNEILKLVAGEMRRYDLPMRFIPGKTR